METIKAECSSCNATGLYAGMAERNGAAVVCSSCKGTGAKRVSYRPFTKRKNRNDILRVFQTNIGVVIGEGDGFKFEDFGGMPYEDWKEGKPFPPKSEMRKFACPAWYYQSVDYSKIPKWDECVANLGRSFKDCPKFNNKQECWGKFDKENDDS